MNTLDFFPVATPEAFAQLMHAKAIGGDAVRKFKSENTDLQRFKAHVATKSNVLLPYEGSTYNSINSFYLVNDAIERTAVRWSFIPSRKQELVIEKSENFFFRNLTENLAKNEVAWNMVITIANSDDVVDNAALPWIGDHQTYVAAKLIIKSISKEQNGKCDLINFDPLVLAPGFEPSEDPLLKARRNTYAIGFGKRISEQE
jgi:catalase